MPVNETSHCIGSHICPSCKVGVTIDVAIRAKGSEMPKIKYAKVDTTCPNCKGDIMYFSKELGYKEIEI